VIDREKAKEKLRRADLYWDEMKRIQASIKPMNRAEYLRKYPDGGPERYTGSVTSDEYREFYAAIKRRDREARRPGVMRFWWAVGFLGLVFIVVSMFATMVHALFVVLVLAICYCFVQMGMNLPHR
jgi:hypothetical protein